MNKCTNYCKMMSWNARSLVMRINELPRFTQEHNVEIIALCETLLKPHHKLKCPGFTIYRSDQGRGVALLIKNTVQNYPINLPELNSLDAIGAIVKLHNLDVLIISAYLSPAKHLSPNELRTLLDVYKHVIILGDLNSKHRAWNCHNNNRNGTKLLDLSTKLHFQIVAPTEPTYYCDRVNVMPSVLDLSLVKNIPYYFYAESVDDLSSDHNPVIYVLGHKLLYENKKLIYNFREADWKKYRSIIDQKILINPVINCPADIDSLVEQFQQTITESARQSIPLVRPKKSKQLPIQILVIIKIRNIIKKKYQLLREVSIKILLKNANKLVSTLLSMHRNKKWNSTLSSLSHSDTKLYKITKAIRNSYSPSIPPLIIGHTPCTNGVQARPIFVYSDKDKANTLANHFEKVHSLNINLGIPYFTKKVLCATKQFSLPVNSKYPNCSLTTPKQVSMLISKLKNNKSPGDDGICPLLIKNLSKKAVIHFTLIINHIIMFSHFPDIWKIAKIISLPKPRKNHSLPESYRPISLLSSLGKIVEKVILKILNKHLARNNILSQTQFGFRAQHSTVSQLAIVTDHILHNFNLNKHTGMVLIDLEKAFDSVWHNGLIYKLIGYGFPKFLIHLIASYLRNRKFYVSTKNASSKTKHTSAGVPQGSVLAPTLFNIYINGINDLKLKIIIALFADDTAFYLSSYRIDTIANRLSEAIKKLLKYLNRWKMKINERKTLAIIFTRRRPLININVQINGQPVPWSKKIKYLGVHLDSKLTFTHHINAICDKTMGLIHNIYPLFNKYSELNINNKKLMYYIFLRSVMSYAAPIWANTCKTNYNKLQIVQNKCLRIIGKFPRWTRIDHMHTTLNIPSISTHIYKLTLNFFNKCQSSPYEYINALATQTISYKKYKYKRLRAILD